MVDSLFLARNEGQLKPEALNLINLVNWLETLVEEYTHLAKAKNLEFISEFPERLVMLRINPDLMRRQVVTNSFPVTFAAILRLEGKLVCEFSFQSH
ncbi:hypothetical protein AB0758_44875 [Tolypothrix bouteillei VB521301_2]|uniref:hypothetical protein n=1 Tax=Tolypothrix bouteillei TaxID=1246981 RepID=UPI0038B5C7CC